MSLIPLDEIPTLPLLYKLQRIAAHSSPVHAVNASHNAKIALIRNDITKLKVDSIVNAANESLLGGGGVDGAIHRAAGPDLLRECHKLDGCDTGSAKITNAYELPCQKVIHAVGPVYFRTKREGTHEQLLRGCYRTSLDLAEANGLRSIAFSALSTGVYGYPSTEAAEAAISEVRNFLDEGQAKTLTTIIFCNFLAKDEDAYHELLPKYFPSDAVIGSESDEKELEEQLPEVPTGAPESDGAVPEKKQKTSHETEDEDWEKIEKADIPQRVSVEDAVDEEKGKI